MILTQIIRPKVSPTSVLRLISPSPTVCRPMFYTTASPSSRRQHRYLQTATSHRPSNLLDAGAPLPQNTDAPLSSLTGQDASYLAHPPRPPKPVPALQSILPKVSNTTPTPQPVKTEAKPIPTTPRASKLRTPRKAAMTLTPSAVSQLRTLLDSPDPKFIRVGVKNRGCSGLAYNLEYVEKPGKFDEEVVQDGVRVLIDSKALFSIIGSEMDWVEDKLSARFVFNNPNISKSSLSVSAYITQHSKLILSPSEEQCGCGESFMVSN